MVFEDKITYDEIGKLYNVTGAAIRKIIKTKFGIELPTRRKINPNETFNRCKDEIVCLNCGKVFNEQPNKHRKFCSHKCSCEFRHKVAYKNILEHPEKYNRANYNVSKIAKDFIMAEQNNKCAICGITPIWNGKKLVFVLDHIDGHASNNSRSNLRCICPNCDSQLDTYKSKNKKSDRTSRR